MSALDAELQRLREAEQLLTSITSHAPEFILQFDRDGIISYMNRPAPGHSLDDMLGTDVRSWMEPQFHDAFAQAVTRVFETKEMSSYESVGSVTGKHYVNRISPVVTNDRVASAILITHDVTDMKQAERRAQQSEQRYRALVEASFEGLAISVDRVFVDGNKAVADMFGYTQSEMIGATPATLATPESQQIVAHAVRVDLQTPYEVTCIRKDGTTFACELMGRTTTYAGQPARITGFRDLTERHEREAEQERREERVRHAQKLETLGVLAGGIAHDFNNLLGIILANAGTARRSQSSTANIDQSLDQINNAVERARELTDQLLVYAGRAEKMTARVNLSDLVNESMELLHVSISKKANLRCDLAQELPMTDGDASQLQQIVMNLIINASESFDGNNGDIAIRTGVVTADAPYLEQTFAPADSMPGDYVFLEVRDTGVGMDALTTARIFDPFFTTKATGRGLGLAAVRGIITAHKGALDVQSTPDEGTIFLVLLPVASSKPATAAVAIETSATTTAMTSGTVLLAEDEPAIADVVRLVLEDIGCCVLTAADGEQAIEMYRSHAADIDLVMLDLTMPKKDGLEVLAAIRVSHNHLPAILASGYSNHSYQHVLDSDPHTSFLAKPYSVDELIDRVKAGLTR